MRLALVSAVAWASFVGKTAADAPRPSIVATHEIVVERGCSQVVATATPSVGVAITVYRHDGERLAGPTHGNGRVALAICGGRAESLVAVTRADSTATVTFDVSRPEGGGADAATDLARRSTSAPFVASAPARVAAAVNRFAGEGLAVVGHVAVRQLRTDDAIAMPSLAGSGCRFLVVAVDGGDVRIAGLPVRSGEVATTVACAPAGSPLEIRVLSGTPRMAHAFVGEAIDPERPIRARQLAWARSRGFALVRELELLADAGRPLSIPIRIRAHGCAAVLAAAPTRATLGFSDVDGSVVGVSVARQPAPVVVRCAESEEVELRAVVDGALPGERIVLLVMEAPSP